MGGKADDQARKRRQAYRQVADPIQNFSLNTYRDLALQVVVPWQASQVTQHIHHRSEIPTNLRPSDIQVHRSALHIAQVSLPYAA